MDEQPPSKEQGEKPHWVPDNALRRMIRDCDGGTGEQELKVPAYVLKGICMDLLDRRAAPEPPAEWQPIETAPKKYTPILLKQDETIGEGWHASQLDIWEFANPQHVMRRRPTHWMPLPVGAAQPPGDGG